MAYVRRKYRRRAVRRATRRRRPVKRRSRVFKRFRRPRRGLFKKYRRRRIYSNRRIKTFAASRSDHAVTIHRNVTETFLNFNYTPTTSTAVPQRIQMCHTDWLPPANEDKVLEGVWDSFATHKLKSFKWSFSNPRLVWTEQIYSAAYSGQFTTPAAQNIVQYNVQDLNFWIWRMGISGNTTAPGSDSEGRMEKHELHYSSPKPFVSGRVPISSKTLWPDANSYADFYQANNNSDTYLYTHNQTPTGSNARSTASMPSPDIFIMPDDVMNKTRFVDTPTLFTAGYLNLMFNVVVETKWTHYKQKVANT